MSDVIPMRRGPGRPRKHPLPTEVQVVAIPPAPPAEPFIPEPAPEPAPETAQEPAAPEVPQEPVVFRTVTREPVPFDIMGISPSRDPANWDLVWSVPADKVDVFARHHHVMMGRVRRHG